MLVGPVPLQTASVGRSFLDEFISRILQHTPLAAGNGVVLSWAMKSNFPHPDFWPRTMGLPVTASLGTIGEEAVGGKAGCDSIVPAPVPIRTGERRDRSG